MTINNAPPLQFRAGSAMQVPLLWQGDYLGVLICANAARGAYEEIDYRACETFARLAAALWIAQRFGRHRLLRWLWR